MLRRRRHAIDALAASSPDAFSEENTCSLVVAGGDHGTHVAGIVGAFNGKERDDGVAPGCQLVSIKIGDSRVGTMETGSSLRRALVAARRLKVDVVNLSWRGRAALQHGPLRRAQRTIREGPRGPRHHIHLERGQQRPGPPRRPSAWRVGGRVD